MPLDDSDPYWAARFRMPPDQMDRLRREAEEKVRAGYHAATRAMAGAGETAERLSAQAGAAVDRFKVGVQSEIDKALGGPPAARPVAQASRPPTVKAQAPSKRDAARDFGAGIVLDRVAQGEVKGHPVSYDTTYGFGKYDPPEWKKPITQMTVDELDNFQTSLAKRGGNSPVGKYQINLQTMRELRKRLGLSGNELYLPELQERMGRERLMMAGYDAYLAGEIDDGELQHRIAGAWSSVADRNGESRWGQPVGTTAAEIKEAIGLAKAEADRRVRAGADHRRPGWR